jgi:hypothetical protein
LKGHGFNRAIPPYPRFQKSTHAAKPRSYIACRVIQGIDCLLDSLLCSRLRVSRSTIRHGTRAQCSGTR